MSGCLCFSHARCRSCNGRNAFKSSFFPSPLFINPRIIVLVSRVQKRKTTPTQPIAGARHDVKRTCGWDKDTNERIGAKINQGRKETIRIWRHTRGQVTSYHLASRHVQFTVSTLLYQFTPPFPFSSACQSTIPVSRLPWVLLSDATP